ncbi:MAG: alpha/beta hydrolase [Halopseudomonas sp.]
MTEPQEITIQTPYHQIAARAWGPETGRKVLAVHGWLDNAASFDLIAPLLPDLRIVAIDMPGHGRSSHRAAGVAYHFVDYVADVIAAADGLGWQRFSFISHSLGAGVSSVVSAIQPERIEQLVMIEGIGPYAAEANKAPEILAASIKQMARLGSRRTPIYPDLERMIKARVQVGDLGHASAKRLVERNSRRCEGGFSWTTDPRLTVATPLYLTEQQVFAHLGAIQAPSLLINADQGNITSRPGIEQRYAAMADLRIKTLPGGHHLHMESPAPVAQQIQAFMAKS